ncbi:MAG: type I secretion system permease/ATPase [Erythrobacter sp.]|nr:type I secretion system permease/ATPase [Erythrobacter sp.]
MQEAAPSELRAALSRSKSALVTVAWLSALINVLLLGGPIYMLLIYDSVLPSGSFATLFGLLIMVTMVYVFQALFDLLRLRILADVGVALDARMTGRVQRAVSELALRGNRGGDDGIGPLRDLDAVRGFLSSPGPCALIDLPWMVLFLALLTLLHVWLGVTALAGALVLAGLTIINDRMTRAPSETALRARGYLAKLAQDNRRHIEVIRALGMGERVYDHWHSAHAAFNAAQDELTRIASVLSGASRIFRLFLQSLVLTVGALLYLAGEASAGIIFASSILAARALAPIDQAIAHWGAFLAARQGWARLDQLLDAVPEPAPPSTRLPAPTQVLQVEGLAAVPPGANRPVIEGVSFTLEAGDGLGIIGPSAAGKTTLVRMLVGLWQPAAGAVRLDGASLDQWDPDDLGVHLGYLPQQVELFDATIAQNIARMTPGAPSEAVIAAARSAGVHDMVVRLPDGYDTQVGSNGSQLSAGQRQRIGLARALYGDPFLVVLDEPNSNLDAEGEAALDTAIAAIRARGAIIALVAHRPAALRHVNKVLVLQNGRMAAFGDRDAVLGEMLQPQPPGTIRGPAERTAPAEATGVMP